MDNKKKKIIKIAAAVIIVISALSLFGLFMRNNVKPTIVGNCEAEMYALGTNAIINAISIVITRDIDYDDMFTVVKEGNKITMVQANSPNINRIANEIANITQANLEDMGEQSVHIASGTFTGFSFLMGFGPDIEIKFTPIGSANCDFISEFASAGINQTLHKIYITVKAEIYSVSSIYDIQTTVISEVL
ncbi:MAG TPA: sporulation protein YunB, partial [Clostridia bacterium]|nr:sporulation protein YunB [Clostridia bacterium]